MGDLPKDWLEKYGANASDEQLAAAWVNGAGNLRPDRIAEISLTALIGWIRKEERRAAEERALPLRSALGQIAECANWCDDCEPTERKLATYVTHLFGLPMMLCDEHAERARAAHRRAESKGCGKQPDVEPYEQEVETAIALRALGLLPAPPPTDTSSTPQGEKSNG